MSFGNNEFSATTTATNSSLLRNIGNAMVMQEISGASGSQTPSQPAIRDHVSDCPSQTRSLPAGQSDASHQGFGAPRSVSSNGHFCLQLNSGDFASNGNPTSQERQVRRRTSRDDGPLRGETRTSRHRDSSRLAIGAPGAVPSVTQGEALSVHSSPYGPLAPVSGAQLVPGIPQHFDMSSVGAAAANPADQDMGASQDGHYAGQAPTGGSANGTERHLHMHQLNQQQLVQGYQAEEVADMMNSSSATLLATFSSLANEQLQLSGQRERAYLAARAAERELDHGQALAAITNAHGQAQLIFNQNLAERQILEAEYNKVLQYSKNLESKNATLENSHKQQHWPVNNTSV